MVKSACGNETVYMCYNETGDWCGETTCVTNPGYSGSQSHTTRRGRASCSLWYALVANVCDLLLFLDENSVIPRVIQAFLKGHFPGWRVVHGIVFPLWRISYDLTQKSIHPPQ